MQVSNESSNEKGKGRKRSSLTLLELMLVLTILGVLLNWVVHKLF